MPVNQKLNSSAHDILVLQRAEPMPTKLLDTLQRKGYSIRVITDKADTYANLLALIEPILMVDCGNSVGSFDYMKWFFDIPEILEFPVLVIGKDVDGLEEQLSKKFGLATTLRGPCTPSDLTEAVRYISKVYRRGLPTKEAPAEKKEEANEVAPSTPPPLPEIKDVDGELPLEASHQFYSQAEPLPNLLFQQLQNFNLLESTLGGDLYPALVKFSEDEIRARMPNNEIVIGAFHSLSEEVGRWGSFHLIRTGIMLNQILHPFQFESVLCDNAHIAALLFPYALNGRNRSLLRKEYLGRDCLLLRKELGSLIKDSALQIGMALKIDLASNILGLLGRLVGRETTVNDEPMAIATSAIMAAEYADRICFNAGNWNPRAAYGLIRRIKSGKLRDFHPAVLCCLVKLLCEAVTVSPPAYLLSKAIRDNPMLKDAAKINREQVINNNESKVSLSALAPGMKLSKPLFAFDGRKILSEDLILDEDLILRIWQLSALRPLNSPVVVLNKEEQEQ